MASAAFNDYVQALETVFDQAVTEGSDDELFASGYLRGHFDLVVAQLELNDAAQTSAVLPAVQASVDHAKHELAPADMVHIQAMLQRLADAAAQAELTS